MSIRLSHLSAWNPPPGDAVMGVFKVYADDSGDDADPQHAVISVAGYLSDVSRWSTFEVRWDEVLRKYEVEYLHMKEWWDRDGTYKELKKDKEREASFFRDLVQVIRDNITYCVSSVVRLNDFQRFNSENGLALDAFSFALYACLLELRNGYPDDDIEIIIDKISKPYKRIDLAKQYARMDTFGDLKVDSISILPLEQENSFKTTLPIQAADFMAWELRKLSEERKEWEPEDASRVSLEAVRADYRSWTEEFVRTKNRKPRYRLSAWGLEKATPHKGYIWDIYNIRAADSVRHKNGWG